MRQGREFSQSSTKEHQIAKKWIEKDDLDEGETTQRQVRLKGNITEMVRPCFVDLVCLVVERPRCTIEPSQVEDADGILGDVTGKSGSSLGGSAAPVVVLGEGWR